KVISYILCLNHTLHLLHNTFVLKLRHACGYFLINKGESTRAVQDFLGHRNIMHTERYTKYNANRFRNIDWSFDD
ncbi:MAG: tyrosine-type recombinase/integrase, partial [Cyanobacteria bacterium J06636_27]